MKKAPPIGIIPREYWLNRVKTDRYIELKQVIKRYLDANMVVPQEWIDEHIELTNQIK